MTFAGARQSLVWLLRAGLYLTLAAMLFRQCTADDAVASFDGIDPVDRQVECFENDPPLFYDQSGTCFSVDPTGLSPSQRNAVTVVPTVRLIAAGDAAGPVPPGAPGDGPAPPTGPVPPGGGPVTPGGAPTAPVPPGLIDPRSPDANPPAVSVAVAPTGPNGSTGGQPTPITPGAAPGVPADTANPPPTAPADPSEPAPASTFVPVDEPAQPTSPSLGYIAEDGHSDTVTEGPLINGIQVWVHAPSRTLYADSCAILEDLTGLDDQFGPSPEAPGYGSICPQL